jgi:hypothetical protein
LRWRLRQGSNLRLAARRGLPRNHETLLWKIARLAIEALVEGEGEALTRKAIERALERTP